MPSGVTRSNLCCEFTGDDESSCAEIAAWCGCTERAIKNVEHKALAKVHREPERAGIDETVLIPAD